MEKIKTKIVGWKVVTPNEEETKFVELLDQTVSEETSKPLNPSLFERIETLKEKVNSVTNVRPRRLDNTWRLKPPHADHSLRVTLVANITPEGKKVPYEILLNTKNPETFMHLQAHALVISSYFREAYKTGISLNSLIQTLKDVFDPKYPSYRVRLRDSDEKPTLVHSIVAEIGYVIEEFYEECLAWNYANSSQENPPTEKEKEIAFNYNLEEMQIAMTSNRITVPKEVLEGNKTFETWIDSTEVKINNTCPKCGNQLTKQSGCDQCLDCGYSKCS